MDIELGEATSSVLIGHTGAEITESADSLSGISGVRISGGVFLSRRVGVLQDPRLRIIKRVSPIKET